MKPSIVSEDQLWAKRCLNMSRIYSALTIIGLIVLFMFIVVGMVASPSLMFWRTASDSHSFTIVENCYYLAMIFTYLLIAIATMFAAPDFRQRNYAFLHGTLIGFSYPFSLFMLGESSAWWTVPSSTWGGVSILSAIMSGMVFCGAYVFWILFSQPAARKIVTTEWKTGAFWLETCIIGLWHIALLGAIICMLWAITWVQSQQGFALVINCLAYLGVLCYTYPVRFWQLKTHLALGTLFGANLALFFMTGKWTFNFAARYLGAQSLSQAGLYIGALSFNAGAAVCSIPLLCMWPFLEAKSDGKGREGEAYYSEDVRAAA